MYTVQQRKVGVGGGGLNRGNVNAYFLCGSRSLVVAHLFWCMTSIQQYQYQTYQIHSLAQSLFQQLLLHLEYDYYYLYCEVCELAS